VGSGEIKFQRGHQSKHPSQSNEGKTTQESKNKEKREKLGKGKTIPRMREGIVHVRKAEMGAKLPASSFPIPASERKGEKKRKE